MASFPDHILVIPQVGIGHITPLLALAKRLSAQFRISFVLSDYYADLIVRRGMLPPPLSTETTPDGDDRFNTKPANFRLIRLESTIADEFTASQEITEMMSLLAIAQAALPKRLAAASEHYSWDDVSRTEFGTALENRVSVEKYYEFWPQRPKAVFTDTFAMPSYIGSRPSSLDDVPIAAFQPTSARAYSFFLELFLGYTQSQSAEELGQEIMKTISSKSSRQIYEEMQQSAEGISSEEKTIESISPIVKVMIVNSMTMLPKVSVMLIDTLYDLEHEVVDKMNATKGNRPVIQCVGPLCCYDMFVQPKRNDIAIEPENQRIFNWFNKQGPRTVVYVSFGSMAFLDEAQVIELERALLTSGHPCLWTLRRKTQQIFLSAETRSQRVKEEEDFIDYSSDSAQCLIVDWSPQRDVLAHPAMGAFVSHCGWNSVQETLSAGVPVVCWPMFAEQHGNAADLKRLGVAEILADTRQYGRIVPAEEICAAIHRLVDTDSDNITPLEKSAAISKSAKAAVSSGGKSQQHWADFSWASPSSKS